jgi:hypothetical protein
VPMALVCSGKIDQQDLDISYDKKFNAGSIDPRPK